MSSSMELLKFHGIPWNLPYDLEKFHGIPWNCKILILINFIIREVYFTVFCVISCYFILGNPLVVEILRYRSYKATVYAPNFGYMAIFHSKWRLVLLSRLFRRRSKKTSKLCVTGRCGGIHGSPVNSPDKRPVTRKMFPFDDVIMEMQFECNRTCWDRVPCVYLLVYIVYKYVT